MSPTPCLCKVDCGLQQGPSPFLLLAAVASLVALLIALLTPKQSIPTTTRERTVSSFDHRRPDGSDSGSDTGSDNHGNSGRNDDSDSDSDTDSVDSRRHVSPLTIRADVESRLAAFQREQEASLQEFRTSTSAEATRQRRILTDRSAAESGRLTAQIDNLRRRFIEQQVNLNQTNRAIEDLRSRGPRTPTGSPRRPFNRTPSPPGIRERSGTPVQQRIIFQQHPAAARSSRDNQANVPPILSRDCRHRRPQ